MHLSKQISETTSARDFANLERYQNRQPSIYNHYYAINLITAVEKLPPLSKPTHEITEANLQETKTQSRGVTQIFEASIENKVAAYHHEIDRLNLDVQINQYSIGNVLLGRGAHSTVRLAKSQDGFFAIKILWFEKIRKKYFIKQKHLIEMVNAQISLLMRLRHPNIIQLKEAIYSSEKERMFIDHFQAFSIADSLSKIKTGENKLEDISDRWSKPFLLVHENKVVHRDIKPQNMLLSEDGKIKIIDFNISHDLRNSEKLRVTNKFIGTKGYAAPQLIIGTQKEKMIEGKALDIWSLGITLLELLERKHPFSVKTIEELHKYLSQEVPINETYPEELKKLLRGMLRRSNEERMKIQQVKRNGWVKGK